MKKQQNQSLITLTQQERLDVLKEAFQTSNSDSISKIYATAQKIYTRKYPCQRFSISQQNQR